MRILISAYACRPGAGSEEGLGWNIPWHLAGSGHDVVVLTRPDFRADIERQQAREPQPGLSVHYVHEPQWTYRLGWTVGSALRYELWQWHAATKAQALHADLPFDVVHHVSYGTLLGASFLWRIGAPLVFGPTGGGQTAPDAFLGYFGDARGIERLRSFVVRHLWRLVWPARRVARSARILVTNADTEALARRLGGTDVERMVDVGLPESFFPDEVPDRSAPTPGGPLRLLWVGRMMPRKGLQLTLEAVQAVPASVPVELHVVGDAIPGGDVRPWVEQHSGSHPVVFHGRLPHADVRDQYRQSHIFILTSLRDSCPVQNLEAMAWGLPIVTLDLHGTSWLVPDDGGRKVRVSDPATTRAAVAAAIAELAASPEERQRAGSVNVAAAAVYSWPQKVRRLEEVYTRLVAPDYAGLNAAQAVSEVDDFTVERYRQFAARLPAGTLRILDVGCNVGAGGAELKRLRRECELVGLDVVPEQLETLPRDLYRETVCADARDVPLSDASVDAVVAGAFIEHIAPDDIDTVLGQFHRVLQPGGVLLMTTPHPGGLPWRLRRRSPLEDPSHLTVHAPRRLEQHLARLGFAQIELVGSGRMTRRIGEVPVLALYGSYLVRAVRP